MESAPGVEPADESGHEAVGDVLRDQDRRGEVGGEQLEDAEQRRGAAGRRPYRDGRARPGHSLDRLRSIAAAIATTPHVGYHADVGEDLHLALDFSADALQVGPVPGLGLLDDLERTQVERIERASHALAVNRRRDDEDRRRRERHDALGRLEPVHLGHVDVHGDQVRTQPFDQFDGLLAVVSLPDYLDLRVRREDLRDHLSRDQRIVGDDDADVLAWPGHLGLVSVHRMRRSTVSSSVSWLNTDLVM